MAIEIRLIGFGDDQPPRFSGKNQLRVDVDTPTSIRFLLQAAGIDDTTGLVLMDANTVIPSEQWDQPGIQDETSLTILSAFEGG